MKRKGKVASAARDVQVGNEGWVAMESETRFFYKKKRWCENLRHVGMN